MPRLYAEGTSVPVSKTRGELHRLVKEHGGTSWLDAEYEDRHATIGWVMQGRMVRFTITLPTIEDRRVRLHGSGQPRTQAQRESALAAETRRVWRALLLAIKAKLTTVADGIVSFEEEFLAHLVMPGGTTLYEAIAEPMHRQLESGQPGDLLPPAATTGGRS